MPDIVEDIIEDPAMATGAAAAATPADPDVVVIPANGDDEETLPPGAMLQEDGSVIYTFRFPVVFRFRRGSTGEVTEQRNDLLHLHRLNGAAMRAVMAAGGGERGMLTAMAKSARMEAGLFNRLYDRMDGADAQALAQIVGYFLDPGATEATGQPTSP